LHLRVLLINGAGPKDSNIEADKETSDIESILATHEHAFDVESIQTSAPGCGVGVNQLEAKIRKFAPHVLHFIGHSEAPTSHGPAALILHDGAHYVPWPTPQIATFLEGIPTLQLSYLNACRTQQAGPIGSHLAAPPYSLAAAFLKRSLAVIAMQYDIRGVAAALCAGTFYSQLAQNHTVDQAICAARHELTGQFSAESSEPYLPSLVVRVHPETILSLRPGSENITRKDVEDNVSPVAMHFVNHRPARRDVYTYLFGSFDSQRRAVLVIGNDGVGKSWLIKWTLYSLVLRGIRVHYVGKVKDNWLDILRQIRSPGELLVSQGCCNEAQANRFNWALKHLKRGDAIPEYTGTVESDAGEPLAKIQQNAHRPKNEFPQMLCRELLAVLAAGPESVLALDQWDLGQKGILDSTFQILHEDLFRPLAQQKLSPVRLVLSLKGDIDPRDFPGWAVQKLDMFEKEDLPELAVQLLKKMYGDKVKEHHVNFIRRSAQDRLTAQQLHESLEALRFWIK
jgi:hypothetical protein